MTFSYDFEAINKAKYKITPDKISSFKTSSKFDFFHDKEQKKYISNQVKMYSSHAEGLGRMLAQSDIRLFFRSFVKSI